MCRSTYSQMLSCFFLAQSSCPIAGARFLAERGLIYPWIPSACSALPRSSCPLAFLAERDLTCSSRECNIYKTRVIIEEGADEVEKRKIIIVNSTFFWVEDLQNTRSATWRSSQFAVSSHSKAIKFSHFLAAAAATAPDSVAVTVSSPLLSPYRLLTLSIILEKKNIYIYIVLLLALSLSLCFSMCSSSLSPRLLRSIEQNLRF